MLMTEHLVISHTLYRNYSIWAPVYYATNITTMLCLFHILARYIDWNRHSNIHYSKNHRDITIFNINLKVINHFKTGKYLIKIYSYINYYLNTFLVELLRSFNSNCYDFNIHLVSFYEVNDISIMINILHNVR